jgi:glycosyltransferase 2 family protein
VGERWPWLVAAQGVFVLFLLAATLRWHLLLRARGIATRLRDTGSILLMGWLFNQTMPSSTGGDVFKATAVALEHPERRSAAVMSIAVDRFSGLLPLLALALVTAALNASLVRSSAVLSAYVVSISLLLAGALAGTALFYSDALRGWLARRVAALLAGRVQPEGGGRLARLAARLLALVRTADQAVYAYRSHPRTLVACMGLSLTVHLATIAVNLCLTWALLGRSFDWWSLLLLIPLAHVSMAVPLTPGSIGVAENVYALLFGFAGIDAAQGAAVCVLQRLIWYSWALVGALILVLRRTGPRARSEHAAPSAVAASTAERLR